MTEEDWLELSKFFESGLREEGFEKGIQLALERILVAPDFLWRVQRDPANHPPNENYKISDVELASRLSFFFGVGRQMMSCYLLRNKNGCAILRF